MASTTQTTAVDDCRDTRDGDAGSSHRHARCALRQACFPPLAPPVSPPRPLLQPLLALGRATSRHICEDHTPLGHKTGGARRPFTCAQKLEREMHENRSAPSLLVKLSRRTPGTALPAASLRRGDYLILNSLLCAAPACASSAVAALRRVALFGLPHCRRAITHCRTAPLTYHTYPNALSLECTALTVLRNAGTSPVLSSAEVTVRASFGARYVSPPDQEHVVIAFQ